jgi:hypothetical protein
MVTKLRAVDAMFLPQFALALREKLEDKGKNMAWLAKEVDTTYEHARKICKGTAFPSRRLLKDICRTLNLKEEDMWRMVVSDKLRHKYGEIPRELAGQSARSVKIERLLPKLTDEQFEDLLSLAEGWAQRNRPTLVERK